MDSRMYKTFLKRSFPEAVEQSGGKEIVVRCKYCPDNGDHHHMYISVPESEHELSYFNCFKCHTSGAVTSRRLMEWGIFDTEMSVLISDHNKTAIGKYSNLLLEVSDHVYNTIPVNADTPINLKKLEYINNRLGLNLTLQEITNNGIILNLVDALKVNHVQSLTRDARVVQALSDNFLGFLSLDKAYVNMRNLCEPGVLHSSVDNKYINYNIYGKKRSTMKFIVFPTSIDTMHSVDLHIAEGPFDALSVKYNLRQNSIPNAVYGAVTGNAYKGFIKYFIYNCGIMEMNIHLYLDNDIAGTYMIDDLLDDLRMFTNPIYIHYNTIGKDMGVSRGEINESVERIK